MRKLMSIMLGLSLLTGVAATSFAQDDKSEKKEGKKKGKGKKKDGEPKKEG